MKKNHSHDYLNTERERTPSSLSDQRVGHVENSPHNFSTKNPPPIQLENQSVPFTHQAVPSRYDALYAQSNSLCQRPSQQVLSADFAEDATQSSKVMTPSFQTETAWRPKRQKGRKWPWILMSTTIVLLLSFIMLWLYLFSGARTSLRPVDFLQPDQTIDEQKETENLIVPYDKEVTHILLIGIDSRHPGEVNTNSDTMIVLTLDQKKQQIRLTSFQRDMLVRIDGREGFYKLNSAMFDGPYTLMKTLNYNFKLDISKYVIVDFLGAERIVDLLGGASLHVPESEEQVAYLNAVIWDTNVEMGGENWIAPIKKGGYQELNGRQALAFARIRKLDSDFFRMQRQQELINELFRRFKAANPLKKIQVIKEGLGLISTNMSDFELVGIATSALPKINQPIESLSVPIDGYFKDVNIGGVFYILAALNDQIPLIHQHLYQADHSSGAPVEEYPYGQLPQGFNGNNNQDNHATDAAGNAFGLTDESGFEGESDGLTSEDGRGADNTFSDFNHLTGGRQSGAENATGGLTAAPGAEGDVFPGVNIGAGDGGE